MKMTLSFIRVPQLAAAAALLTVAVTSAAAEGTFDRTVTADPRGSVEISNVAGKLVITGWDKPEVAVHAELGPGVERVDLLSSGGRTIVKVVLPSMSFRDGDTDLEVHVPKQSEVQATAVSADLETSNLLGEQRLRTVSGALRAAFAGGADFEAKTVSGDMRLRGAAAQPGTLRLGTVSGDIIVNGGAGEVEATSVSGDVRLEMQAASSVRLHSTSGDLTFRGALTEGGSIEAETMSGDVTLRPRAPGGFDYEATSFSGNIGNCFDQEAVATSRHGPGSRLTGSAGEGKGGRVRVKTMTGDIDVCDH
ncbi:MAG TPA: DUF4097 family beta strand repeat-containing protein [Steroidobacteraceae bacterium]|nr:DUF4097 family beta strand repeat-containing protein [Steroidobacteraceae bacterium]